MPIRFCSCGFTDDVPVYYCPECDAPFFPNAKKGSRLRPGTGKCEIAMEEAAKRLKEDPDYTDESDGGAQ